MTLCGRYQPPVVQSVLSCSEEARRNAFEDQKDTAAEQAPAEIVARSAAIKKILEQLNTIALSNSTVLMIGETGVGKELFAEYLHKKSVRRVKPLVKNRAAMLPRELVESELFGHEKGAFRRATSEKKGD